MPLPLLLLPGMMCDARLFAAQIAQFSRERAVQVAPIDGAETMTELAEEVLRHAPPRFALAGLSMGGIVAMEMLRLAPDRIERIGLLDTNPLAEAPEVRAGRQAQIDAALSGALDAVMREEMKPRYLVQGPGRQAVLDLCLDMALDLGPDVFARQSRALRDRPDQRDTLQAAKMPALVLCGAEDTLCPLERHELMRALIPGAVLEVIPGAGHLPVLEQPVVTNAALSRWLTASGGAG